MTVNQAPSFKVGDAEITTSFGISGDFGKSVAVQTDGKILVAGYTVNTDFNTDFAIARYNQDGSLDSSFNFGGKVTTPIGISGDSAYSMTLQGDGKILIAGISSNGTNFDFALTRYNNDGTLDTGFSGDGKLTTSIGVGDDYARTVLWQDDGKILVVGVSAAGDYYDLASVRYNADGSLDNSYGVGGKLTTVVGKVGNESSATLQADGKILVAGMSSGVNPDFELIRYNIDGSLDVSFSADGKLTTSFGSIADVNYSVTVQQDGKILTVGASHNGNNYDFALARYNADGSLDSTFDGDGKLTTEIGIGDDQAYSVVVQPDGKILVTGSTSNAGNYDFVIVRYNANGSLDTSFNEDGKVTTAIGQGNDYAYSLTLQSDGKILVAGESNNGINADFALVRYNPDGSLDLTFDGVDTLNASQVYIEKGNAIVLDSDVKIFDAELSSTDNYNGASVSLVRDSGANEQDVFSAKLGGTLGQLEQGLSLKVAGINIGTVITNSHGTLELSFNSNATQSLVNSALQQIAYSNNSEAPTLSAKINWMFDDGNTGSQGTGGALTALGSTAVSITATNDAPTFSTVGILANNFGGSFSGARSVAIESDGKLVVAGSALARYNTDGTLDSSFVISNGIVASSVTLQPDGKIVVAGTTSGDFSLARYNTDGTLDTSFGSAGKITTDFGGDDRSWSSTLQSDGKILVSGISFGEGGIGTDVLARYNADGSLDTSFDNDGKVSLSSGGYSIGNSVFAQENGKILLAGGSTLARYNTNGSLDTSFDGDGMLTYNLGGIGSILVQADGKIVVAGSTSNSTGFTLARYNTDGSADSSFDGDGKVTTLLPGGGAGNSVTIQSDGKILVAGFDHANGGTGNNFALARYNANGSLDTTFDGDGIVTTDFSYSALSTMTHDAAWSVKVQADGKIVVVGTSLLQANGFDVVRYNSDGTLDNSFGSARYNTLNNTLSYTENSSTAVLDETVSIYDAELAALGGGLGNYNGASLTLSRHGGANVQDVFSGTGNLSFTNGSVTLSGVTVGSVSNGNGILTISFNNNATQSVVNQTLSAIAYSNTSDTPPSSVQIDWTFNDGNAGTQGTGGASIALGSNFVYIYGVNDAPLLSGSKAILPNGTEDTSYTITTAQLLTGYTDAEGDAMSIFNLTVDHGNVINNNNGSYSIIPSDNYIGLLNLSYIVNDDHGGNVIATQSFNLNAVNDNPPVTYPPATVTTNFSSLSDINFKANQLESFGSFTAPLEDALSNLSDAANGDFSIFNQTTTRADGLFSNGTAVSIFGSFSDYPIKITSMVFSLVNDPYKITVSGNVTIQNENSDATGGFTKYAIENIISHTKLIAATNYNIATDVTSNTTSLQLINSDGVSLLLKGKFIDDDTPLGMHGTISSITLSSGSNKFAIAGLKLDFVTFNEFSSFNDVLTAVLSGNDAINGTAASETLFGFDGNDSLKGLAGIDTLEGADGNDTLDGGAGADIMSGGAGDDVYIVDSLDDEIDEQPNGGIDTVRVNIKTIDGTYVLGDNLENAAIISAVKYNLDGNELSNSIIGNAEVNTLRGFEENDTLDGGAGKDILIGGIGDDSYIVDAIGNTDTGLGGDIITEVDGEGNDTVITKFSANLTSLQFANIENLTLFGTAVLNATGNAEDNVITGNTAANILDGGAGLDTLIGGKGNDTYIVDTTTDIITELAAEGTDTILSSVSYDLTDTDGIGDNGGNIENLTLTGTDAINATGNALANKITGNTGNNVLDGVAGVDSLIGGAGDDTYKVDFKLTGTGPNVIGSLQDTITESANQGNDTVELRDGADITKLSTITLGANLENLDASATAFAMLNLSGNTLNNTITGNSAANKIDGGAGNDSLSGNDGDDSLIGGAGNDTLLGGDGIDTLVGGAGNDVYLYDDVSDVIVEVAGSAGGIDTVQTTLTFDLSTNLNTVNVENLTLLGSADIGGTGNVLANYITGNDGFNILIGGAGNDTLDGGGNGDSLEGGAGNDTYIVDDLTDTIVELADEGIDTIQSSVSLGLAFYENIENLTLTGGDDINATGSDIANVLIGNDGNNQLTGGDGIDTLKGSDGDDTYFVKLVQVGSGATATVKLEDIITENLNEGFDEINLDGDFSSLTAVSTLILGANIEALRLDSLSTNTTKLNIVGNALNNNFVGNSVANKIDGGAGNDTIYGGGGNDTLIGGAGNDDLLGNEGVDSLQGGAGNDRYYVDLVLNQAGDGVDLEDIVIEAANSGTDELSLLGTFNLGVATTIILGANIENLTAQQAVDTKLNLTGNTLNNQLTGNNLANMLDGGKGNDTLFGREGDDTLIGDIGNDNLNGNEGADMLIGGLGNDTLDGDAGLDSLVGGLGNDTYVLDDINDVTEDSIVEAANEGIDTVNTAFSYSLSALANVENIILSGSGSINATGNTLKNVLIGNSGNNSLSGGAGNDTLTGGDGDDTLDGGTDADSMVGGNGNDTYTIDNLGDIAIETSATGGTDTLRIALTGTNATSLTLSKFIENVVLLDNTDINYLVGNNSNNVLTGNNNDETVIDAGAGNDTIIGGSGNNSFLYGGAGDDSITGGINNDIIEGAAGNDTLNGGAGSNNMVSYYYATAAVTVDLNVADGVAQDTKGAGIDTLSNFNNILGSRFNDTLKGDEHVNFIRGDFGNDTITAGAGNDILWGESGNDLLDGGDGIDTAGYTTATAGVTVNLATGKATGGAGADTLLNIENITGSNFNDKLTGNGSANTLEGGAGNDTLDGGDGIDTVSYASTPINSGGVKVSLRSTMAQVTGGSGTDTLISIENLTGSSSNDILQGNGDDNILNGGFGSDTASYEGAASAVTVSLAISIAQNTIGDGTDTLISIENLIGSAFNDTLTGNASANVLNGGLGDDTLNGGDGNDTASYEGAASAVTVSLITGLATGGAGSDTLTSIENLTGSSFNDVLTGSAAANFLIGAIGDDTLIGDAGNDTLLGGAGNDVLDGGEGSDIYIFTAPAEHTIAEITDLGAMGIDEVRFASVTANTTLSLFAGDTGIDKVVIGTGSATAANTSGTISLNVNASAVGNALNIIGNSGNNIITGTGFNDTINGGAGNDKLIGGAGSDTLTGGLGKDLLTGGLDDDHFVFSTITETGLGTLADVITDFSQAQSDMIDLSLIDAISGTSGVNDTFSFIGTNTFGNIAGQLRFDAKLHAVLGDTNGDGTADFQITLTGVNSLDVSDFLL